MRPARPTQRWHRFPRSNGPHGAVRTLVYQGIPIEPERQFELFLPPEPDPLPRLVDPDDDGRPPWE